MSEFIQMIEGKFYRRGIEVLPQGINSYPLLELGALGRWDAVESVFHQARLLNRPIVRTNAFHFARPGDDALPSHTVNAAGEIHDEGLRALDQLLVLAASHGMQLLLTLSNHWADYGGGPALVRHVSDATQDAPFYREPKAIQKYLDYLAHVVRRTNAVNGVKYAHDATIFAWELCNEPRYGHVWKRDDDALTAWAQTVSSFLKAEHLMQPIAWGGSGHFGEYGENVDRIAQISTLDILTLHTYPQPYVTQARDRKQLADVLRVAAAHGTMAIAAFAKRLAHTGKGLLVEEIGWPAGIAPDVDQQRASLFTEWLECANEHHIGFFPWMIGEPEREDYDGYLIRPETHPKTANVLSHGLAMQ